MLEFMMTLTNGNDPSNLVPIALRHPLIKSWVFCKQLMNQPIPKNLGHDDEVGYPGRVDQQPAYFIKTRQKS